MSVDSSIHLRKGSWFNHLTEIAKGVIQVHCGDPGQVSIFFYEDEVLDSFLEFCNAILQTRKQAKEVKPKQEGADLTESGVHGLSEGSNVPFQSYDNVGSEGLAAKWEDKEALECDADEKLDTTRKVLVEIYEGSPYSFNQGDDPVQEGPLEDHDTAGHVIENTLTDDDIPF